MKLAKSRRGHRGHLTPPGWTPDTCGVNVRVCEEVCVRGCLREAGQNHHEITSLLQGALLAPAV